MNELERAKIAMEVAGDYDYVTSDLDAQELMDEIGYNCSVEELASIIKEYDGFSYGSLESIVDELRDAEDGELEDEDMLLAKIAFKIASETGGVSKEDDVEDMLGLITYDVSKEQVQKAMNEYDGYSVSKMDSMLTHLRELKSLT